MSRKRRIPEWVYRVAAVALGEISAEAYYRHYQDQSHRDGRYGHDLFTRPLAASAWPGAKRQTNAAPKRRTAVKRRRPQ